MLRKYIPYALIMLLSIPFITSAADLSQNLDALFYTDDIARQEELIAEISSHDVPINTLITLLKNTKFKKGVARGIRTAKNMCIDGIERPYYLYIPENYDHNKKTPLLVYLHGGVSRKDISEDDVKYFEDLPFVKMAEEQGYILLFPMGQYGATWWDSVGIANILQQIRVTKREYNIDDNRIFMTGFSDGGSGSFLFAMTYPSYFAGFLPLNGHPGVGSEVGKIQTYFVNLFNRPVYVINTDEDGYYPADKIHDMLNLAHEAGADIFYRIYTGIGHEFAYAEEELPRMVSFMENNPRHLRPLVKWESAYPDLECMWLRIDSISGQGHATWYKDHNMEIIDDRVMFGFYPDDDFAGIDLDAIDKQVLLQFFPDHDFKGPAVKISKVIGDSTLCAVVGIKDGDVIIKLSDMPVNTIEDIYAYKENKRCGDPAEIVVLRDGEILAFKGQFPGPTIFDLFTRGRTSGRIEGYFSGNTFSLKTSQIGVFTIKIHPDMVQIDQNIVIIVNGEVVFDKKVRANPEYLLKNYLKNRDRERLYVNEITIALEE
ncbi:MAG: dienelactone hydrolase family protein [bacterium]